MDTKIQDLIEKCKDNSPNGCCESCGCNQKQCLESLLDELTEKRLEKDIKNNR